MPTLHVCARVMTLGAAIGAATGVHLAAQGPAARIAEPLASTFLTGAVVLRAEVEPESAPVRSVEFSVDGMPACRVTTRPFQCSFDAGPTLQPRRVRLVVTLTNGEPLTHTVITATPDVNDAVSVSNVLVPVVVTDQSDRFVHGLRQDLFQVFDNEVRQTITFFQAEDVALEVALAVDVSASMQQILPQVKVAARRFIEALKPTDSLSLLAFNDRVFVITRQDADARTRAQAVEQLNPSGNTALRDAIIESLKVLGTQVRRRALIIFTDGEDTTSTASLEAVASRLRQSDASLFVIAHGDSRRTVAKQFGNLVSQSGGRLFTLERIADLNGTFSAIREDLGNQYLLGYASPARRGDGTYHKIRVTVAGKRYRVRARDGYSAQ